MVALACADGTVRVFDAKDGKERWQKKAHASDALAVAFGPKDAIATGGADGKMALFASDGKALGTNAGVGDFVLGVGFGETDAVVFGADAKGSVQRWEGKKVEVVTGLRGVGQQELLRHSARQRRGGAAQQSRDLVATAGGHGCALLNTAGVIRGGAGGAAKIGGLCGPRPCASMFLASPNAWPSSGRIGAATF